MRSPVVPGEQPIRWQGTADSGAPGSKLVRPEHLSVAVETPRRRDSGMALALLRCDESLLDITEPRLDVESYLQVRSRVDKVLLEDDRVMRNMLAEERKVKKIDYCASLQTELKPHMRKIVVDWMLEVCQDQQCQSQVFYLALNYMDRFLSKKCIKKTHFQLLSTVCIFLSSKMCECVPIAAEKLLMYTDNSVTLDELLQWEMMVLATLHWELSPVTALSFLEHLQNQACVRKVAKDFGTVQQHADHLLSIMVSEYQYLLIQPSLLAAAALVAAGSGLITGRREKNKIAAEQLGKELSQLIQHPAEELEIVTQSIEAMLQRHLEIMSFRSKLADPENVICNAEYLAQSVL
jgi:hypothetical protein